MKRYLSFIFLLLFAACNSASIFAGYQELSDETWNRYHVLEFTTHIPDSGLYEVRLCLRHTTDYEMANLWCFISTRSSLHSELKDTVNLKVAEPDGQWLGQGNTIKTIEQRINENPVLLPQGQVIFRIEQGMRIDNMKGIKNVGLKVLKVTNPPTL